MGVIVIFLLAVLFVAAVWGREQAQKLFGCGLGLFLTGMALVAILVGIMFVDFAKWDAERSRSTAPSSTYSAPAMTAPATQYVPAPAAPAYRPDLGNPKIGVSLAPLPPGVGASYGLQPGYGVFVGNIVPGTTAYLAGIRKGDYISQVDGQWISSAEDLNRHNVGKRPGDIIVLRVLRGGQQYLVRVPLGNP
jgi:S1-C subfamily serine protease